MKINFMIKMARRLMWYWSHKYCFKQLGYLSYIDSPLKVQGAKNITIGSRVNINYKTWLAALSIGQGNRGRLQIGDRVEIGHFNHIIATGCVVIEEDVLTADKVYISDNLHGYQDIFIPIKEQEIVQKREVRIGAGSWLGENVCIIGAKVGRHCVIGANSVVTKDIPDYCVAVGSPARVIKKYCFSRKEWVKAGFGK